MSKFKNTEELEKAYKELEREFTKKSQKLAESEKSEETYKSMFEIGVENNHSLLKEIEQLKQQLAEKEAEIEKWKSMAERSSNLLDRYNRTGEIGAQDKISFAVAELEKAKIEFETYYADNIWNYPQYLEDRIKLLKEEK